MGLYDREYMRKRGKPAKTPPARASLWKRLLFRLWLVFRGRGR